MCHSGHCVWNGNTQSEVKATGINKPPQCDLLKPVMQLQHRFRVAEGQGLNLPKPIEFSLVRESSTAFLQFFFYTLLSLRTHRKVKDMVFTVVAGQSILVLCRFKQHSPRQSSENSHTLHISVLVQIPNPLHTWPESFGIFWIQILWF